MCWDLHKQWHAHLHVMGIMCSKFHLNDLEAAEGIWDTTFHQQTNRPPDRLPNCSDKLTTCLSAQTNRPPDRLPICSDKLTTCLSACLSAQTNRPSDRLPNCSDKPPIWPPAWSLACLLQLYSSSTILISLVGGMIKKYIKKHTNSRNIYFTAHYFSMMIVIVPQQ